jgi:hypothetical protein
MEGITLESLLAIPAGFGLMFNDIFSLISVIGCSLMFLSALFDTALFDTALFGAPLRRLGELGEWCSAPLVFGTLFQIALISLAGLEVDGEKIGLAIPMTAGMVNGLFAVSFLLLAGRWWLRRKSTSSQPHLA